jgi:uncharacterized protein
MQQVRLVQGRRLALMLLLYSKGPSGQPNESIEGRTRLTKMLFLLDKEHEAFKRVAKLEFVPYAFGPYDAKLYDDLAFLENMGWLRGSALSGADTAALDLSFQQFVHDKGPGEEAFAFLERPELYEADLSFDYLMTGVSEAVPERYETRKYALSTKGEDAVKAAMRAFGDSSELSKVLAEIEGVKRQYNNIPLRDFLRYVFRKYPDSATPWKSSSIDSGCNACVIRLFSKTEIDKICNML